jgi:predicted TIM-barrel fold metal-dependent hydrolase
MTCPKWKIDAIDSHVHIWTDDLSRYPLDAGFTRENLAVRSFLPDDILSKANANGVSRVVLIQMSYYGFDNSLMLDAVRLHPARFCGIAVIDENDAELAPKMRQLRKSGVRGFRVIAIDPEIRLADRPGLQKMMANAASEQMVMDFLTAPEILPELDQLCDRFPDTAIIVDHMARIGMSAPVTSAEVNALCRLARHPTIAVKISAFYALGKKRPPHDDLEPMIRQLYNAFGPSRLMWGSDAPFQTMNEDYKDSVDFVRDRLPFLTDRDKNWILRDTAERLFFS